MFSGEDQRLDSTWILAEEGAAYGGDLSLSKIRLDRGHELMYKSLDCTTYARSLHRRLALAFPPLFASAEWVRLPIC